MINPILLYRLYHSMSVRGVRLVPRLLSRFNYFITGCDLPAPVRIGKNVRFPHYGSGVVVHSKTDIGDNVWIMPGVTIGQNVRAGHSVVPLRGILVETGAMLGAGCKIIATGSLTIGAGSAVGANAVVTTSVPAGVTVAGNPARLVESSHKRM